MAGGREIKTKIKSVHEHPQGDAARSRWSSASKIRKAQERMKASRPYRWRCARRTAILRRANSESQHPYLVQRTDVKRVGYIIVSSDRGLAGGLNNNLFRKLHGELRKWQRAGRRGRRGPPSARRRAFLPPRQGSNARFGLAPWGCPACRAADRRGQGHARCLQPGNIDKVSSRTTAS